MNVVSDMGPLHYLILIGAEHVLPCLFDRVLIPPAVLDELNHPNTACGGRATESRERPGMRAANNHQRGSWITSRGNEHPASGICWPPDVEPTSSGFGAKA